MVVGEQLPSSLEGGPTSHRTFDMLYSGLFSMGSYFVSM